MVEMMQLTQLFTDYQSPYGNTWPRDITGLIDDPIEGVTVMLLAEAMLTGELREPVTLFDGDSEDPPHVSNGMHRIAAAVIAGGLDVPVSHDPLPEHQNFLRVELSLSLDDGTADLTEMVMDVFRSFPLDANHWVESDIAGGRVTSGTYYVEFLFNLDDDVTPVTLVAALEARATAWELPVTVVASVTRTAAELDARVR